MKLVTLPLVVSIAVIGFQHRNEIADLYRAAYPADPVKREALEECAHSPKFQSTGYHRSGQLLCRSRA
jgi:hypothetical protein